MLYVYCTGTGRHVASWNGYAALRIPCFEEHHLLTELLSRFLSEVLSKPSMSYTPV
jgi:hypothetical protein